MTKIRIVLEIDENDVGPIWRLVAEGKANIRHTKPVDQQMGADEFIRKTRQEQHSNGSNGHHHRRVDGLRTVECIVAIMQSRPDDIWEGDEIGIRLESGYAFDRGSASGSLTTLVKHQYVQRIAIGKYVLTELGKKFSQNEMLPFSLKG